MERAAFRFLTVFILISAVGCAHTPPSGSPPAYGVIGSPQIFEGMGSHTRAVTTTSQEAQQYFNQGLNWLYAFNHDEAVRSFRKACQFDSGCAMAWWGISYAQGPNYNDAYMGENRSSAAWVALERALEEIDTESEVERALIEALAHRYQSPAPEDRTNLEVAYSEAMAEVWERFPADSDVGTLYAESIMVQNPWQLYTRKGEPAREATNVARSVLEQVLIIDPENPGANHLYIHALEPSRDKEKAIAAADRLSELVPASGHLLHMPSHIYAQVGLFQRSIEQNIRAMEQDARYRELSPEQGMQYGYMTHNSHMLAFSAMMLGDEELAMRAARAMWADLPGPALQAVGPFIDRWLSSVYDVQKRFGRWEELLAEPAPPEFLPVTTAIWHAHRAIAHAALKDFDSAEHEQKLFREAMRTLPESAAWETYAGALKFLLVSDLFIEGELALQKGQLTPAIEFLEEAAELEDTLGYGEPPLWLQPVRHTLGVVYLQNDQPLEALRVYREDLSKWPDNIWSLIGSAQALETLGRVVEANDIKAKCQRLSAGHNTEVSTSCFCVPST